MSPSIVSAFSENARRQQSQWKACTPDLSEAARVRGLWRLKTRSYVLPAQHATQTLWSPIRAEVLDTFERDQIVWHDVDSEDYGARTMPGPPPHLMSSQVACLNFWWGLSQSPTVLATVLKTVFPELDRMVPPVAGGSLIAPEWIGARNYLGEADSPERPRRRGQFTTSADLLLAYEDVTGRRHGIMVESKYSERYVNQRFRPDRVALYGPFLDLQTGPIRRDRVVCVDLLLIEPFYQHLRQQLLAAAMEDAHELEFESVSVLHVAPKANRAYHEGITSPSLTKWGNTISAIWVELLRDPSRYRSISYEAAFNTARVAGMSADWIEYQSKRYAWASEAS